ncbi:MAG: Tyrosine--tRNA ligase [Alphaproteobacteria bacterium MarineAlpha5_Bin7]|nr:MAG: Tyrosine--tRNA ligase [Alphaproteobacteria bacterium MarineAlpha5_Bin7]|tara:strand:+ start:704 stop:1939 length:1236 start_codon:yes stop_codon:yes gene_type:complete
MLKSNFLNEIKSRGFIYQSSEIEDLDDIINKKSITAYIGFDITNDSLHIGSLVQLMLLHWLDHYNHKPIALMGGGTTLVGDPSGKDESRKILKPEDIENNILKIEKTFNKFINLSNHAKIINNYDWLSNINYINFLRDIGSKVTINKMITFESVKNRLDREQPLTFLEFNYMMLQAYDFYHLNKHHDCILQMGGSDQWGNIISGIDLIRRLNNKKAFAITSPLITNNDGSKMGKTADGAIWLDENKFSNFEFYQFWRNIDDSNVPKFLNLFTKLPLEEISKLSKLKGQEINEAKKILAFEVTKMTRGQKQANEAEDISNNIFENNSLDERIKSFSVSSKDISNLSFSLLDAMEKLELVTSRSEVKRLIKSNGIKVNNEVYNKSDFSLSNYTHTKEIKINVGKKKVGLIKIT